MARDNTKEKELTQRVAAELKSLSLPSLAARIGLSYSTFYNALAGKTQRNRLGPDRLRTLATEMDKTATRLLNLSAELMKAADAGKPIHLEKSPKGRTK